MLSIFRQQLDRGQSLLRLSDHETIDQVGCSGIRSSGANVRQLPAAPAAGAPKHDAPKMPRALIEVIESSGYHPCFGGQ